MKNKFLSLAWFKEKLRLESKEEKLKRIIDDRVVEERRDRLFRNIKLINSSLTIVLEDGTILTKPDATEEDYNKCMIALSVREIKEIITDPKGIKVVKKEDEPEEKLTEEDVKVIATGFEVLHNLEDFSVNGDSIYWGEIKRSLPQRLVEALCKLAVDDDGNPFTQKDLDCDEEYLALKKFWLKCCLNPNAQSAEDLYTFLNYHRFKIDRHGNFYAYRRVKSKHTDVYEKELMEFVSNSYVKVKAVWKYNPKNFAIHKGEEGYNIRDTRKKNYKADEAIGNLADMYATISITPGPQYTSAHTGKEDYRIGEVMSMPRHEGDDNNNVSCSTGFHAASKKYDYSGFGDVPILMIINPTDVLSVPKGEIGKLRTCRWFFACVLSGEDGFILDEEHFDVTNLGDTFEDKIQENLEADIARGFAEEVNRHSFYVPSVSGEDVKKIVKSLEFMQKAIKERVQKI